MTEELCLRLCYGTGAKFLRKLWNGRGFVRCFRKQLSASPKFITRSFRDIENLNFKETAEALGISVPSVKGRLHRAHMMLQKQLGPLLKSLNPRPKRRWLPWL
jgi:Sigma-70, region 4